MLTKSGEVATAFFKAAPPAEASDSVFLKAAGSFIGAGCFIYAVYFRLTGFAGSFSFLALFLPSGLISPAASSERFVSVGPTSS